MNILVLSHEAPPLGGGGGRAGYALAQELVKQGHRVDMVTAGYRDLPAQEAEGDLRLIRVRCLRRKPESSTTDEKISYVWAAQKHVRRLLRETDYDLIHCHFIVPGGLLGYLTRKRGVPYVITAHGSDVEGYNPDAFAVEHRLMRPLWRCIVRNAAAVISPSETFGQLILKAAGGNCPPLHVIPYGFSANRFSCSSREKRILLVSRLLPRKGFQYLLKAIEGIDLGYEVDIVGDGTYRPELERLAQLTPTKVNFWGWVANDSEQMRRLYETASVFVLPSEAESFGVVLAEAMDAGLTIITSNVGACPDVVGDAAVLVPPRDADALRRALLGLLSNREEMARLGDMGRQRLQDVFDWPVVLERYEEVFERARS